MRSTRQGEGGEIVAAGQASKRRSHGADVERPMYVEGSFRLERGSHATPKDAVCVAFSGCRSLRMKWPFSRCESLRVENPDRRWQEVVRAGDEGSNGQIRQRSAGLATPCQVGHLAERVDTSISTSGAVGDEVRPGQLGQCILQGFLYRRYALLSLPSGEWSSVVGDRQTHGCRGAGHDTACSPALATGRMGHHRSVHSSTKTGPQIASHIHGKSASPSRCCGR